MLRVADTDIDICFVIFFTFITCLQVTLTGESCESLSPDRSQNTFDFSHGGGGTRLNVTTQSFVARLAVREAKHAA